mmetsp:Transcript_25032/g.60220  ORF Transcript_25032/g.60220 Transcript_25032/m.60220 type:complete len:217 (+) Transcript_25032:2262-2912(+)
MLSPICRSIALSKSFRVAPSHSSTLSCSIVAFWSPNRFANWVRKPDTFSTLHSEGFLFGAALSLFLLSSDLELAFLVFSVLSLPVSVESEEYHFFSSSKYTHLSLSASISPKSWSTLLSASRCLYSFVKCFIISLREIFPSKSVSIASNCRWIARRGNFRDSMYDLQKSLKRARGGVPLTAALALSDARLSVKPTVMSSSRNCSYDTVPSPPAATH